MEYATASAAGAARLAYASAAGAARLASASAADAFAVLAFSSFANAVDATVNVGSALFAAYAASDAANATNASGAIWSSVEADIDWLMRQTDGEPNDHARRLALKGLWPNTMPPEPSAAWQAFKADLGNGNWGHWTEWYEQRLKDAESGFGLPDAIEERFIVQLAQESKAFWEQSVDKVNAEIAARLAMARFEAAIGITKSDEADTLPEVPATRPASLEPEWQGDNLVLPAAAADAAQGTNIEEALQALKDDLIELADDLGDENNIDKRVGRFLRRLAERVPLGEPSEYDIHRLGLAESNLSEYLVTTVVKEWPEFLSARTIGTMRHFDRVMAQFSSWHQFKRNAEEEPVTPEMVQDIAATVEAVADVLEVDGAGMVDAAIPAAMHEQAVEIRGLRDEGLQFNKYLIAIDAREGLRNTSKKFFEKRLDWIKDGYSEEDEASFKRLGQVTRKMLEAIVVGLGVSAVATVSGLSLADLAHMITNSPAVLEFLGGKDGWLAALLAFFASRGGKK